MSSSFSSITKEFSGCWDKGYADEEVLTVSNSSSSCESFIDQYYLSLEESQSGILPIVQPDDARNNSGSLNVQLEGLAKATSNVQGRRPMIIIVEGNDVGDGNKDANAKRLALCTEYEWVDFHIHEYLLKYKWSSMLQTFFYNVDVLDKGVGDAILSL
ncbi:hypothetical protein LR48_Vigan11g162500 [Vigna angularis]|uniref:Uncharacterized protein n=1 Tax=Phaseolus angularis TaxID=3914 RepID=A0A0L9VU33_PHAAN|nr:uncharacterized protein HKW66_Vig0204890 [Vigna angularis]KOM58591.1 hypothetical protein LR48_Vigan11g162500 [Vigna angularis]